MNLIKTLFFAALVLTASATFGFAQTCTPPPIVFNAKTENIFTPEQEMQLGDAMVERVRKDYRIIDDPQINQYLQSIGDRISKYLPDSGIRFRFVVVDINDTNAFAMAGGRIFVTRKMVSFVRNEDELAGVIGHELGHAVVRHHAIDISRYFKQLLGVTSVGDRRDIFEKYNKYIESLRTKRVKFSDNHEDNQQLEADRIGLYASYAAGYNPTGMTDFWKRLTDAKKGGFFSNVFGSKTPADKRYREMIEAMKNIAPGCIDKSPLAAKVEFEAWRSRVISQSGLGNVESLNGLIHRQPLVPLRADIEHLRFSPNGAYLIAQDNSTVTVLQRQPFEILFRVEVDDAFPAGFSADSSQVVIFNKNLRVEKWNIAGKRLEAVHEIATKGGNWQTKVSPDGNYVAAYRKTGDIVIYDVATNVEIFREKEFYIPNYSEYLTWVIMMSILDLEEYPAVNFEFSPDGKYLLAGRKYRSQFTYPKEETLAVDLTTRKHAVIGSNVKKLLVSSMDFLGPDKIIGQYSGDIQKSGIFAFPSGERLEQFQLAGASFISSQSGGYVTVRPVAGAAVGLFDLTQKKYVLGNKKSALDIYKGVFAAERRNGEISLYDLATKESIAAVALPASPFGQLSTSTLSSDGNWLVLSDRSRGAAWDLRTGERVLHIRTFRGAHFASDGRVFADFPKEGETARSVAIMDLKKKSVEPLGELATDSNVRQHGRYMLVRKPIKEKKEKPENPKDAAKTPFSEEERDKSVGGRDITFEVRDVQTGAELWTRDFQDEAPRYAISQPHNTMLLLWHLDTQAAKRIISADPALKAKASALGEKEGDLLVQLIDPLTGKVRGTLLLETGEGSIRAENMMWAGDHLLVSDQTNRILVYSVATGELTSRFFGGEFAVSTADNRIAIENAPGRLAVYDLKTGSEITRLSFIKPVTLMRFVDDGKRFFVLTSDQTAFMFDTAKFSTDDENKLGVNYPVFTGPQ